MRPTERQGHSPDDKVARWQVSPSAECALQDSAAVPSRDLDGRAAAEPEFGLPIANSEAGKSYLVRELRQLPERVRKNFELHQWIIDSIDVLVSALIVVGDPLDTGSIEERLDSWFGDVANDRTACSPDKFEYDLSEWTRGISAMPDAELQRWTKRLAGDGSWTRFARKLLGARTYDRLVRAMQDDLCAMSSGFKYLIELAQPYAVAFDDVLDVLTPSQIRRIDNTYDWTTISAFKFLLHLDEAIDRGKESRFAWSQLRLEQTTVAEADLIQMVHKLRQLAAGPTRERLAELNARLAAKISGAQDALRSSADGVSQAAHSLVELIDRILRTAFPDGDVLSWLTDSKAYADEELTYLASNGTQRPTKRAQALCFAHGGRPTDQPSAIHAIAAAALVSAREQLQSLKHADQGDEVQRVIALMAAVEGVLTLALRLGWSGLDEVEVDRLRQRLAA
jgi:hypothetical protein